MKKLFGNVGQGLPPLIGVLCGIYICSDGFKYWWFPILVLGIAALITIIGRKCLSKCPLLGCFLIEFWVAGTVSILTLGTEIILWLSIYAGDILKGNEAEKKVLASALVGAVTTYLAVLWTKDIQASEGIFWTGTQVKEGLNASFSKEGLVPASDTLEWEAVWAKRVRDNGPDGWGLLSRWKRCGILSEYLKNLK